MKDWPEPARPDDADEVFPEGWRRSAVDAVAIGGVQPTLLDPLSAEERELFEELAAERRHHAGFLREREGSDATNGSGGPVARRTVSVGGVIDYARCPKRFYWTAVRPLPRFSGPAARIGTEVHRWIERRASGQAVLLEVDEAPDLTSEELAGEPGKVERLREAFLGSRFADVTPLHAERPFLLRLEGFTVGGRIDAVYGDPDGPWEVVDWKTGRRPADDDPLAALQLDLYGLACVEIWGKRPEDVTLTYLYLASGDEVSHPMEEPDTVKARVTEALRSIDAGAFHATPGPQCTLLRLPGVLSGGQDRGWRSGATRRTRAPTPLRREPLDLRFERPVARRGIEAALGDPRHESDGQAGLGGDARLRHGTEPFEIARLDQDRAGRPHAPVRRVVDHDRRSAEDLLERRAEDVVLRVDDRRAVGPRHRRDDGVGFVRAVELDLHVREATRRGSGRAGGRFEPCPRADRR